MDLKGSKSLSVPNLFSGEDDFLSRSVNIVSDGESDWSFVDEATDILSFEWDTTNLSIYSREPSREEIRWKNDGLRKSSLAKPIGQIMELKPKPLVDDKVKASLWGKFFSKEVFTEQPDNEKLFRGLNESDGNTKEPRESTKKRSKSAEAANVSSLQKGVELSKNIPRVSKNNCNNLNSKNINFNTRYLEPKSFYGKGYWTPSNSFPDSRESELINLNKGDNGYWTEFAEKNTSKRNKIINIELKNTAKRHGLLKYGRQNIAKRNGPIKDERQNTAKRYDVFQQHSLRPQEQQNTAKQNGLFHNELQQTTKRNGTNSDTNENAAKRKWQTKSEKTSKRNTKGRGASMIKRVQPFFQGLTLPTISTVVGPHSLVGGKTSQNLYKQKQNGDLTKKATITHRKDILK